MKREILNFSNKISRNLSKPEKKFVADMVYGMLASESCLLTDIVDQLHESAKKVNSVERLTRHLNHGVPFAALNSYLSTIRKWVPKEPVIHIDDSDVIKPDGYKFQDLGLVRDGSKSTQKKNVYEKGYHVTEACVITSSNHPVSIFSKVHGIYLQSRYGVLRISPVRSDIVRITFAKGTQIATEKHPKINPAKTSRACGYKDSSKMLEFVTDDLYLQVDKASGAIHYMTRDKKLLLEERKEECRQIDVTPRGMVRSWLYLKWQKDENIFGHRIADKLGPNLRGSARYISHGDNSEDLPLLISNKGYGMVIASDGLTFTCDINTYGSYIYTENIKQMDYYFIAGKDKDTILSAYEFLKG